MGSILSGCQDEEVKDLLLLDVCPLSLGIKTNGSISTVIIPRNTTIPVKKAQMFSTYADNQDAVDIEVCEGERSMFEDNHFLGKFHMNGIPPAPRGSPKIEVTFDMDASGILVVSAEVKESNIKKSLTITNEKGRMSKEEIEKLIKEAELYKEEDEKIKLQVDAKNELENYLYSTKSILTKEIQITDKDKEKINETITEGIQWLDSNQSASKEEYDSKREKLSDIISPIVAKLYKGSSGGTGPGVDELD
jgi:L1 cell adhesion molecule like protein